MADLDGADGVICGNITACFAVNDLFRFDFGFELRAVDVALADEWEPSSGLVQCLKDS